MVNKKNRRKQDIKSKLIAAVCMLLVSTIMMVSSTYAWFTLSTAPEVTGITTAVGANGNLEMALQPLDGDSSKITSNVGDSMSVQSAYLANTTWGNLVDVSDNNSYGLNQIMLYPSKLNVGTDEDGADAIMGSPLAIPAYGADGRVSELLTNKTFTGVYDPTSKGFVSELTTDTGKLEELFGLRGVGTSSGMSDRQLAYRAALQAASTAVSQAKRTASQSLNNNGAALADIAIKHATSETTESYSVAELTSLQTIVNELLGTEATTGSLEYIEEALIQYALATALANVASDDNYQNYVDSFLGSETVTGATLDTLATVMSNNGVTNAAVTSAITALQASIKNVTDAKTILDGKLTGAASDATFAWADFNQALYLLADPDQMQVNGIEVSNLKGNWEFKSGDVLPDGYTTAEAEDGKTYVYDEEGTIVSNMSRLVDAVLNDGIQLIIGSGAGVFADIADFCGDYSAAVTLSKISYGGMTVKNLDANMSTKTSQTTPYLDAASAAVPGYVAGNGGSASSNITDFYGYIIDLAFRTNVADSDLMLQTEGIDRIYSDGTNAATMGNGATMSFTATDPSFSGAAVKNLMSCIRIVFFDTDKGTIIAEARLDATTAETGSDGSITMDIKIWDADLEDADGNVVGGWAESQKIMALEQNTITELSALVYLDGETITNADVANAASSMTGSMNLQFSSSKPLDPMDYTDLKTGTGEEPSTPSVSQVTVGTITDGYTATVAYSNGYVAAVITDSAAGATVTTGTVTIGGNAATYSTDASAWVVAADSAPASVDIVVTP